MTRASVRALLMLPLALVPPVFAQQPARVDDVSAYRRFLIYPHQQRAFAAMKAGDQATAIAEFTRARELAPRSVSTALDLAEAWRHFGQPARAEAVLAEQRRYTPGDQRVAAQPVARDCTRDPAAVCRMQRGYDALRAGELARAQAELDDAAFARSDAGVALQRALAQRAIYLGEPARADAAFAALQAAGQLQAAERGQWFALLLQRRKLDAASTLQEAHAELQVPLQQLAMAHALADAGEDAALLAYLTMHQPVFAREVQERQWLYLLAHVEARRPDLLTRYRVHFAANRTVQARLALPGALARDDRGAAQRALAQLPPGDFGEARFGLALRAGRFDEALRRAQTLVAKRDGARQLDALSYRLIDAGATAQGKQLLMQAYPFGDGDELHAEAMLARLALIAAAQPTQFDAADRARLRKPLGSARLRSAQVPLLASLGDCDGVRAVMGDFDPDYPADRWAALGHCLQQARPGLAEYAYAQASQRVPGGEYTRALAYQAYATQDYAAALGAWDRVDPAQMSAADRLAAATTAMAVGDRGAARRWLDRYDAGADGRRDDAYWWLRAQSADPADSATEEAALQQAIAQRPDAHYYARLAQVQRTRGEPARAAASLERASALAPQDAALAATLGYAWLQAGDPARARPAFERAHRLQPDDPGLTRQLMYLQLADGDRAQARVYAAQAIDQLDGRGGPAAQEGDAGDDRVERERFNLRRLHEDLGRRWRVLGDLAIGDSVSSAANAIAPGVSYRSYAQVEAQYRFDAPPGGDENTLAAYARVFAGSGAQGDWQPVHAPRLGVGVHWKPWRSQTIVFSAEQQLAIGRADGRRSDTLLRASGSWTGSERFSDDWHPEGRGWFAQNIYVDVARYLRARQSVATLDYQWGYHRKLPDAQTLEPFVRLQANGIERGHGQGFGHDLRAGLGVRWNFWYGESRYDAYAHRVRIGLEWQHAFTSYLRESNVVFLTVGGQW